MGAYDLKTLYKQRSEHKEIRVDGNELGKILFFDNILRLTTWDAHRYYECLSVVPYLFTRFAKNILILGGGNGYAAKTLLDTFPEIETIVIVEPDKDVVAVSRGFFDFPEDNKVKVIYQDPTEWIGINSGKKAFDLVIADYTDPLLPNEAKLFTAEYFATIRGVMNDNGVFVIPVMSPLANPRAMSCMVNTVKQAFPKYNTVPYTVHMPFYPVPAHRGFCLASPQPMQLQVPQGMRYLNSFNIMSMFWFDNDEKYIEMQASTDKNLLYHRLCTEMYNGDINEWSKEI